MKNRRLVTSAVLLPVALADRRQDRRRYPVARPVFGDKIAGVTQSLDRFLVVS
ncbi:exported hypothetical protein [Candidatus Sulfopaludibacter sp. SbA3]|nr:exported hypothetical protein [Candidatus Sulfopaludibacter sp. SbA3]